MKKIQFLAIALGLFAFTACSSDDNATETIQPEPVNHLLGSWTLNTMSISIYMNDEVVVEQNDMPMEGQMTWEYTFKSDQTVEYLMSAPSQGLNETGVGTYVKNDNSITITIENEPQTFTVTTLDANNLHLKMTETEEEEGVTSTYTIEQKFVRK